MTLKLRASAEVLLSQHVFMRDFSGNVPGMQKCCLRTQAYTLLLVEAARLQCCLIPSYLMLHSGVDTQSQAWKDFIHTTQISLLLWTRQVQPRGAYNRYAGISVPMFKSEFQRLLNLSPITRRNLNQETIISLRTNSLGEMSARLIWLGSGMCLSTCLFTIRYQEPKYNFAAAWRKHRTISFSIPLWFPQNPSSTFALLIIWLQKFVFPISG